MWVAKWVEGSEVVAYSTGALDDLFGASVTFRVGQVERAMPAGIKLTATMLEMLKIGAEELSSHVLARRVALNDPGDTVVAIEGLWDQGGDS